MAGDGDIKQRFIVEYDGKQLEVFTDDLKKVKKGAEDAGKGTDKMTAGLLKMAAAVATVDTAIKAAKMGIELGELGAQVMTVDKNFQQFARRGGGDAIYMMDKLRKASGGMMNDMVLQQNAMKAMISGIKFDDMIVAMEYVRKYAIATGSDVNEKMTTVMTGLSRGSAQFMDDVGIQVMGAKDVVGATIDQMKQKMSEFADTTEDASSNIANMKTEIENVRQEIGTQLIPVAETWHNMVLNSFKAVKNTVDEIIKGRKELADSQSGAWTANSQSMAELLLIREKSAKWAQIEAKGEKLSRDAMLERAEAVKRVRAITGSGTYKFEVFGTQQFAEAEKEFKGARAKRLKQVISEGYKTTPTAIGGVKGKTPEELEKLRKEAEEAEKKRLAILDAQSVALHDQIVFMEQMLGIKHKIDNEMVALDAGPINMPSLGLSYSSKLSGKTSLDTQKSDPFAPPPQSTLDALGEFMDSYGSIVRQGMSDVASIFDAVYSKQMEDIQYNTQAQIDAVNASTKSEKQKAKDIKKINEQARKDAHEVRMKEWKSNLLMSIANTALGITNAIATGGPFPANMIAAIAVGATGAVQQGIMLANKPRYFYGSRDSSGAYTTVGGNSSGDTVPALLRSNEMVVSGKSNVQKAQAALNGKATGNNVTMNMPISFAVSGSVDRSTADYLVGQVESTVKRVIENNRYTNLFNTALA